MQYGNYVYDREEPRLNTKNEMNYRHQQVNRYFYSIVYHSLNQITEQT